MYSVDVILPFHRDDNYLRIAIRSILESTGVKVRLLLVDDRKNPVLIPDLNKWIVVQTGGIGYARAINSARKYIRSDFVALMNSDDWSAPSRLFKQVNSLKESDGRLSICKMKKFKRGHQVTSLLGEIVGKNYDYRLLLLGAYGSNATMLAHRQVWNDYIYFEDSSISDWLSGVTFLSNLQVTYIDEILYWYRQHNLQITNNQEQKNAALNEVTDAVLPIAKVLKVFDENFVTNFQITAAPYSIGNKLSKISLLNAWDYLEKLCKCRLYGASEIFLRRRLYISVQLLKHGYINIQTFLTIIYGGIKLVSSITMDYFHPLPKEFRQQLRMSTEL